MDLITSILFLVLLDSLFVALIDTYTNVKTTIPGTFSTMIFSPFVVNAVPVSPSAMAKLHIDSVPVTTSTSTELTTLIVVDYSGLKRSDPPEQMNATDTGSQSVDMTEDAANNGSITGRTIAGAVIGIGESSS